MDRGGSGWVYGWRLSVCKSGIMDEICTVIWGCETSGSRNRVASMSLSLFAASSSPSRAAVDQPSHDAAPSIRSPPPHTSHDTHDPMHPAQNPRSPSRAEIWERRHQDPLVCAGKGRLAGDEGVPRRGGSGGRMGRRCGGGRGGRLSLIHI